MWIVENILLHSFYKVLIFYFFYYIFDLYIFRSFFFLNTNRGCLTLWNYSRLSLSPILLILFLSYSEIKIIFFKYLTIFHDLDVTFLKYSDTCILQVFPISLSYVLNSLQHLLRTHLKLNFVFADVNFLEYCFISLRRISHILFFIFHFICTFDLSLYFNLRKYFHLQCC